jgi:hypothetical protein
MNRFRILKIISNTNERKVTMKKERGDHMGDAEYVYRYFEVFLVELCQARKPCAHLFWC